jgi:hypothetical protein
MGNKTLLTAIVILMLFAQPSRANPEVYTAAGDPALAALEETHELEDIYKQRGDLKRIW